MKVGITGVSGQLGQIMAETLTSKGVHVVGWSHKDFDISHESSIAKMTQEKVEIIINCAAWTKVSLAENNYEQAMHTNCYGAQNVAIAAKRLGSQLIHFSTDYVFDGETQSQWKEHQKTNPRSKYGLSKLKGEEAILHQYEEGSIILRTAWLYSEKCTNFVKTLIKAGLQKDLDISVVNDQIGQPTSARALASAVFELLTKSPVKNGIYHLTNRGETSWHGFACEIFKLLAFDLSRIRPISTQDIGELSFRPRYTALDNSKWNSTGLSPLEEWDTTLAKEISRIFTYVCEYE